MIISRMKWLSRDRQVLASSGLGVGEIAALTIADVANQHAEARPEIKLAPQANERKNRGLVHGRETSRNQEERGVIDDHAACVPGSQCCRNRCYSASSSSQSLQSR
jgi:hypothetical protein